MNDPVKVRDLEWTRSIEGRRVFYRADGYRIEEWFGTDSYSFETVRGADEEAIYSGDDLPSAESAAQADYTASILAALDLTGVEALEAENKRLREVIAEATHPDFIFGALDNVNDMDVSLTDFAEAVSRAIRAALGDTTDGQ